MTEEKTNPDSASPKITNTQKEKDPRKVAAGKKLGAISQMAKSQKKYKTDSEKRNSEAEELQNSDYSDYITPLTVGLTVVVVVGCLGILYWKASPQDALQAPEPQDPKFHSPQASLPHREAHSNLISLE